MPGGVWPCHSVVSLGRPMAWERGEQGYVVLAADGSIFNHPGDLGGMLLKEKIHGKPRRSKGNGLQEGCG